MEFRPTQTRRGWSLAVPQEGSEPIALEVRGARVRDGAVRASLVVRRGAVIVVTALVTLTSESARKRFVDSLREREKGVVVPEQALVALDAVCHSSAEPADGPEDHDPAVDEHAPLAVSRPLAELLDAVERLLSRYVIFRTLVQRTAIALWVAHAHAFEAVEVTPYLHVHSAEMESGKTRLLEVLEWLVPRPWHVIGPSEAVLFRKIAQEVPTLLFDEVDTIFRGAKSRTPEAAGLRQVLNAGYRRSGVVPRCSGKDKIELVDFRVFCPKALTGIGAVLPPTVASRCIPIVLARRTKSEVVAKFKQRTIRTETLLLKRALTCWASTAVESLRGAEPAMPDGLRDRAEEVWEPLVAIADLAGNDWPARARQAARDLNGDCTDSESIGVQLLSAIRTVFDETGAERLFTIDLLRALVERETEPWPGWWGREVDQAKDGEVPRKPAMELARYLKPFEVQPTPIRIEQQRGRGYERAAFADPFARYLQTQGRDNVTSVAAQGFETSRPTIDEDEVVTPETLAAQELSRRHDLGAQERVERSIRPPSGVQGEDCCCRRSTSGSGPRRQ
jgi:hypothetical protein